MSIIQSFEPIIDERAKVLILGSIPGKASLRSQQYYGHARNAFWPIMRELGLVANLDNYPTKCQELCDSGVALWDSLQTCTRETSLDSDIVTSSIIANDFDSLLNKYTAVRHIFFNGKKSEDVFKRHVLPTLTSDMKERLDCHLLPSTSPAHASMKFGAKLGLWRRVSQAVNE